jgi:GT2 family glycosyltransferase
MKVALIILNYNGEDIIAECIDGALKQDCKPKIFVIENGSTDVSLNVLGKYITQIEIVRNGINENFTTAYNKVYERIYNDFDIVGLISNDVFLYDKNIVSSIISVFEADSNIGQVAPKSIRPNGSLDLIAKKEYTFENLISSFSLKRKTKIANLDQLHSKVVDVLQDSCVFIKTQTIENKIYDENLKFYFTEDYLSKMIKRSGYKNYYSADQSVNHLVSYSTEKRNLALSYKLQYFDAISYCKIFFPNKLTVFKLSTFLVFLIKFTYYKFR